MLKQVAVLRDTIAVKNVKMPNQPCDFPLPPQVLSCQKATQAASRTITWFTKPAPCRPTLQAG